MRAAARRPPAAPGAVRSPPVALRLAVVVPALDEEVALRRYLPATVAAADQVVVSDGGSHDATREVAAALGATVVSGPPGRGGQLNRGAAAAAGADVLLFLHADTELPPGAAAAIRAAVAAGADGGAFRVRFAAASWPYRFGAAVVNARTRRFGMALGDQAQFVSAATFARLGGYRDWPILEDLDFARRLRRGGRMVVLPLAVTTSARRFERRGIARTVATNWLIWALFLAGVPPSRLARLYAHVR